MTLFKSLVAVFKLLVTSTVWLERCWSRGYEAQPLWWMEETVAMVTQTKVKAGSTRQVMEKSSGKATSRCMMSGHVEWVKGLQVIRLPGGKEWKTRGPKHQADLGGKETQGEERRKKTQWRWREDGWKEEMKKNVGAMERGPPALLHSLVSPNEKLHPSKLPAADHDSTLLSFKLPSNRAASRCPPSVCHILHWFGSAVESPALWGSEAADR